MRRSNLALAAALLALMGCHQTGGFLGYAPGGPQGGPLKTSVVAWGDPESGLPSVVPAGATEEVEVVPPGGPDEAAQLAAASALRAAGPLPEGPASAPWPLPLEQAIEVGLSHSTVARVLEGRSVGASPVTRYDPEIAEARARAALAGFDPVFDARLFANWINEPPSSFFGPGIPVATQRDEAGLTFGVTKPTQTGGRARIAYNPPLGYLFIPGSTSSSINPTNEADISFSVTQPLARGAGLMVNRAPIRVARLRAEQSVWEFKQSIQAHVRSVIEAYWELEAAQQAVRVIEETLPYAEQVVHVEEERMAAQRSVRADVARARAAWHNLRKERVQAEAAVVERELRLRNLLGLPPAVARRIVTTSQPTDAPVLVDQQAAFRTALQVHPALARQRLNVRVREQDALVAKNGVLPQFDWYGLYRLNGIGENTDAAVDQMFTADYTDYETGLVFSVPIGRRQALAGYRSASLQLARERALLQQAMHARAHDLSGLARQIEFTHAALSEANQRLTENNEWLRGAKIRYENPPPAGSDRDWLLIALNDYLQALRAQAEAATEVASLRARYNALLVQLEESQGTLLESVGIAVDDDCGVVCALSESEARRADDLVTEVNASFGPDAGTAPTPLPAPRVPAAVGEPIGPGLPEPAGPLPAPMAIPPGTLPVPPAEMPPSPALPPSAVSPGVVAPTPLSLPTLPALPRPATYPARATPPPATTPLAPPVAPLPQPAVAPATLPGAAPVGWSPSSLSGGSAPGATRWTPPASVPLGPAMPGGFGPAQLAP